MGELIIECTQCGGSFNTERDYDQHPCMEDDTKIAFKIKLEPREHLGEFANEGEEEQDDQQQEEEGKKEKDQREKRSTIRVKEEFCEAMDVHDEDITDVKGNIIGKEELEVEVGIQGGIDTPEGSPDNEQSMQEPEVEAFDPKVMKVTDAVSIRNECTVCGKRFYRREDFLNHTANSHKHPRPYQCKLCKKRFTQKHYVTLHMRVHTGERPYKCKLCSKTYTHKTSFTIHMRIHNGERPYTCDICDKKCYDKSGLTSHMRSHTKETPYECEVCGRRFTHSKSLLVHRRNHTGEKPYKCQYCGKCFRHWHKHKIHIRLHTGERPYKCDVCGKGFPRNDEVKRHMRSHQGIKSFKCSICGVYCATQASITGHIDLHHADLRQIPLDAPEKTVVKNSTCGILGTKAPQPRTIYKPISIVSTSSQCTIAPTQTSSTSTASVDSNIITKTVVKRNGNQLLKDGKIQKDSEGDKTKVLSYKEFIELQEKLLLCKGLTLKNSQSSSGVAKSSDIKSDGTKTKGSTTAKSYSSKNKILNKTPAFYKELIDLQENLCKGLTTKNSQSSSGVAKSNGTKTKASTPGKFYSSYNKILHKTPTFAPKKAGDGSVGKQQIVLLSSGAGKGEGLRLMLPQNVAGGKQVVLSAPAGGTPTSTAQNLVLGQSSVVLPQGQLMGGQQILLLSKPGGNQQNSLMLTQPMLLLSGGGGSNQRMVLLPSKTTSDNGSSVQTLLIPSSLTTTTTAKSTTVTTTTPSTSTPSVVVKQEPEDPDDPPTPPQVMTPNIVIKQEPGLQQQQQQQQQPPMPVIKQEPPDDPPFSSDNFSNVRIKQEPLDY